MTPDHSHKEERELVRHGDAIAFGALTERHRAELRVHCYRMLGSLTDAEDLVQETLLRACRSRSTYTGRASLGAALATRPTAGVLADAAEAVAFA